MIRKGLHLNNKTPKEQIRNTKKFRKYLLVDGNEKYQTSNITKKCAEARIVCNAFLWGSGTLPLFVCVSIEYRSTENGQFIASFIFILLRCGG